jgi:hypothetical protein
MMKKKNDCRNNSNKEVNLQWMCDVSLTPGLVRAQCYIRVRAACINENKDLDMPKY